MPTAADILSAFQAGTKVQATSFAAALLAACAVLGVLLTLAWVFRTRAEALRGAVLRATHALLLVAAAFSLLILSLGVFYRW